MAGKFSAKNRENAVDVRTILAEREQAQKHRSITPVTTPKRKPVQPAAATMPTLEKSAKPIQKPRRGPRLSGVIFYTIFFLCIFLFYTATYFGLRELRDWLNRYEMAQPTTKSQEIFETLFYDPDWDSLYDIANVQNAAYGSKDDFISYILSYNHYFGWYCGTVADNGPWFDAFREKNPDRAIGCSEYGADAVLDWHAVKPLNHDYTEEYEAFYHHEMLKCFEKRPYLWSTHAWNMFDFAADARNEGGSLGINNKGLVTYDRKTYKEAFYICQAYWSDEPMVHVCGERFPNRGPEEHEVIVYSNCDSVTLYVNGEAVETLDVVDHAAVFHNVPLQNGGNTVTAKSGNVEGNTITLNAISEPDPGYILPRGENDVPVGNWFDGIAVGTSDDDMEFPEGFYSVKDTVKEVCAIRGGKLIVELLANIGAFGPIVAIKTMQPPVPLMDFLPQVGNLPAGGMAYINSQLNLIPKEYA